MLSNARKRRIAVAAIIGVFWPMAALAQGQQAPHDQATPARPATSVIPTLSRDLSQDTQFLALLRARDAQFALINELRRIVTYHDNFRTRLERVLNNLKDPLTREQMTSSINGALQRVQKLEAEIKTAGTDSRQRVNLLREFEDNYPVFRAEAFNRTSRSAEQVVERERANFVQRERTSANEVFQNVTIENREWLARYEKLFSVIERTLNSMNATLPRLERLPIEFLRLTGGTSFETMSDEQIQSGTDQYRTALQGALTDVASLPQPNSADQVRANLMSQVDGLGKEVANRSTEINSQVQDLEKNISATAKSLYGNKVGADSFNYLLIVFMVVFVVLMIMPKFYADTVQANILKSEFLLQFSTVFVLIAAIIILGIGELIDKQQLPVLLAGISGYVLGQLGKV